MQIIIIIIIFHVYKSRLTQNKINNYQLILTYLQINQINQAQYIVTTMLQHYFDQNYSTCQIYITSKIEFKLQIYFNASLQQNYCKICPLQNANYLSPNKVQQNEKRIQIATTIQLLFNRNFYLLISYNLTYNLWLTLTYNLQRLKIFVIYSKYGNLNLITLLKQ
eukprot:TRINITY_DN9280_c0_g1_i5.p1 TRINITY_DN9280_c0_g1~~TRINITY_DN9280_c0_g1_i5.p1  ORF type:complete len:186 (-),score=-11.32 TRINITY_DN9280_c0_g1_i5:423-917(-)